MKKLPLAPEIVEWLTRHERHYYSRSHAQREGDVLRYYHPCGHTSWEPWTSSIAMFKPARWAWDQGGVHCTCPRCHRVRCKDAKEKKLTVRPVRNLTRVGPDWVKGGAGS